MKRGFLYSVFKKIVSQLLVMIYLLAGISGPLHSLIIHKGESKEVCSDDENACHRLLVHHDIENGCDHDFHVVNSDLECDLCSLAPSSLAFTEEEESIIPSYFSLIDDWSNHTSEIASRFVNKKLSRGPPMC